MDKKTIIGGVAILILLLCIGWLFPAYKKTVKDSLEKDTLIANLQTQISIWKNKKTERVVYYPNGTIRSSTKTSTESGSDSKTVSTESSAHIASSHELTITKRSLVTVGALWDQSSYIPQAGTVNTNVLGPLGVQGVIFREPFKIMGGLQWSL